MQKLVAEQISEASGKLHNVKTFQWSERDPLH